MHTGNTERLGLVEEAKRKRALYGRYIYRAPALPSGSEAPVPRSGSEAPALRAGSEAPALPSGSEAPALPSGNRPPADPAPAEIRMRIDKRREEIIAAHIEAEARREADFELARARALRNRQPRLDALLQLAAEVTGISVPALKGQRRARAIAWPRQFAMWLVCECRHDVSLPMIGRAFGGRDHTTVMHGLRNARSKQGHPAFKAWMDDRRVRAVLSDAEVDP